MQPGFRTTDDVIKAINARYADLPGVKVTASMPAGAGPGGTPVDIVVNGQDMDRIEKVAGEIEDIVKAVPGTYATELSWRQGRPEVQAHIDRDRAAQYGLSVSQIAAALRTSIEGDTDAKYRDNGKEYDIRVSLPEEQRVTIDQLPMMVVGTTAGGDPVHLKDVVMPDQEAGPTKIERTDRLRSVAVTGELAKGTTIGNVQQIIDAKIAQLDTRGVTVKWYGSAQMMTESFGIMIGALATLHHSRLHPHGRALRVDHQPVHHLAGRAAGHGRRAHRLDDVAYVLQHHVDDRHHHARRPGDEEFYSHGGLRQHPAPRAGSGSPRGAAAGRPDALAPHPHDHAGDDLRHAPHRHRALQRLGNAPTDGRRRHRRPAALPLLEPAHDPHLL